MEFFVTLIKSLKPLTNATKNPILDPAGLLNNPSDLAFFDLLNSVYILPCFLA